MAQTVEPTISRPASRRRLATAVALSLILLVVAPFAAQVRAFLRALLSEWFVVGIAAALVAAVSAAVVLALRRINQARIWRWGLIGTAVTLAVFWGQRFATGDVNVDIVEHVHFVQYGLVTALFYRAWSDAGDISALILPAFAATLVGLGDEWLQWLLPVRIGELRDVLLNTAAVASGLMFSVGLTPPAGLSWSMPPHSRARVLLLGGILVLALAAFIDVIHLGGEVQDTAEQTRFRSRYRSDELRALARERAALWATSPPQTLRRLAIEDQYFNEALWHVAARNDAWSTGDRFRAWRENRILEEYFAPALDVASYVSPTGFRWPPEQREDAAGVAERRRDETFVSGAHRVPIFTWSRVWLWGAAGSVFTWCALGAFRLRRNPVEVLP